MKAIVISSFGEAGVLQLQDVEEPKPSADEILVKVRATALNRADLLQRMGHYPPPPGTRKDIPGLEFSGEVEAVGQKASLFQKGDRVMGLLSGEGYAEKVVTHERMALPIPENLSFEEAAAIPEAFMTAYDALLPQLDLKMGERCLIHAVGSGVGMAALQIAKVAGATVFGTTGSEEKLGKAEALGLDFGINYKTEDFQEIVLGETNGKGVHAILDTIGASYWEKNLACLKTKGRLILVGMLGGSKVEANLGLILRKRIKVMGTVLRARPIEEKIRLTQNFKNHVLPLFEIGKIKPVIDSVFKLEDAVQAHTHMEDNKNFGKIILKVSYG